MSTNEAEVDQASGCTLEPITAVGEAAVAIVSQQAILSQVGKKQVRETVFVEVADRNALSIPGVINAGAGR